MKPPFNKFGWPLCVAVILATLAGAVPGQKAVGRLPPVRETKSAASSAPHAAVAPVVFDNANIDCADLDVRHQDGTGDVRFAHIINNWEMKLNFGDPNGTFPYTNGVNRIVIGPEFPARWFNVVSSSNPGTVANWSSTLPVTAINVKVGNTSYVYPYAPFRVNDTNLATGDGRGISHITVCFGEPTGPTAAEATVSGRVVDSAGVGISKAHLVLINGVTGESKITMTNPFGYYRIDGVEVNEFYILNISHKRYVFAERQRTVMLTDSLTGVDFVADPLQ